ncbi:MAG: hypothetical protein ACYC4S_08815 [Rhodoferax sp.]
MGILTKALIDVGFETIEAIYQQSYPQNYWISIKSLMNQGLKPDFASPPELITATWALA